VADAAGRDFDEVVVGGRPPELAMPQIGPWDTVTIRADCPPCQRLRN